MQNNINLGEEALRVLTWLVGMERGRRYKPLEEEAFHMSVSGVLVKELAF